MKPMKDWVVAILSAGQGKRMKTDRPKVLHPLVDRPILYYIFEAVSSITNNIYIVISPKLYNVLYDKINVNFVVQDEPLGTGDAVKRLLPYLKEFNGNILVLPGDVPLIKKETLERLCLIHEKENNACTILTTVVDNPSGYGRIVRDEKGNIVKIVEDKDATLEEKNIKEINTAIYAFDWNKLKEVLPYLNNNNAQKEYYLPDALSLLLKRGEKVNSLTVENWEVLGVNSQKELANLHKVFTGKINEKWMDAGVTIISPDTVTIGKDVLLENDVIIYPNSVMLGRIIIKKGSVVGYNVYIKNYTIGEKVEIGPNSFISCNKSKEEGD